MNQTPKVTTRERMIQIWLAAMFLPCAWYGALAVHEAGHALHALFSGGVIQSVDLPLIGFSLTHVQPNPHPWFVVLGGFVWGVLGPWVIYHGARRLNWSRRYLAQAFAAFCLLLNGAYLGLGGLDHVGDAGDLMALGTPAWMLAIVGILMAAYGLWLAHRIGSLSMFGLAHDKADRSAAVALSVTLACWVAVNLVFLG